MKFSKVGTFSGSPCIAPFKWGSYKVIVLSALLMSMERKFSEISSFRKLLIALETTSLSNSAKSMALLIFLGMERCI